MDGRMPITRKNSGTGIHGDEHSPVNAAVEQERPMGLFFCGNTRRKQDGTFEPLEIPVFGNYRITRPIEAMYEECPNIYFADFFCIGKKGDGSDSHHVVMLVMTRPGSMQQIGGVEVDLDEWCQQRLPRLNINDPRNNLVRKDGKGKWRISSNVFIHFFYTEDVPLEVGEAYCFSDEEANPGATRFKDYTCVHCNIVRD